MNTPAPAPRAWDKVEKSASLFLQVVLLTVLGMRLSFDSMWKMPPLDLWLCAIALPLVAASLWFARNHRGWRLSIIALASATQLVPMVVRQPVLLFPLLGAMIPVAILLGCVIALSRKDKSSHPQPRS